MNREAPPDLLNPHALPRRLLASFTPRSLLPLIAEIWSYLSAHTSVFPPADLYFSARFLLNNKWMLNVSIIRYFPTLSEPALTFLHPLMEDNTQSGPLSFPIVSLPISPSETFLPFGSPAFEFKSTEQWPLCLYAASPPPPSILISCVSGFVTPRKREISRKTDRDFLIL